MSKPQDTPMPANEHATLTTLLTKAGAKPQDLAVSVGSGPQGRTRKQIADALITWLKTRPKA